MVDPLEAVLEYLRANADLRDLVDDRIASKHQFGSGWAIPCKALQIQYDGGAADIYTPRQVLRLEARCYGESQYEAARVYAALAAATRVAGRETAMTTGGRALLYWLALDSGPVAFRDPDVEVDAVLVFLKTAVAENDVPI